MYEEPNLQVMLFSTGDVICASGESEWKDENVDNNGWT